MKVKPSEIEILPSTLFILIAYPLAHHAHSLSLLQYRQRRYALRDLPRLFSISHQESNQAMQRLQNIAKME